MLNRSVNILKSNSLFLFGARGTGKSTLIRQLFANTPFLEIDLLDAVQFEQATFALRELVARIESAIDEKKWIFIDEVQKAPRVLDSVQRLIDRKQGKFILTGSSARKFKRGGANLLAGRAYSYHLFPLTSVELGTRFDLDTYLSFGGLPTIWNVPSDAERVLYLRSYISTYLKEEISEEQIVRNLEPFGRFLHVAAQSSGKVINYSAISKDVGVSDQTVKTYFQILEDTLLGHFLPAFHESVRKSQGKSPKFYLFDPGVLRALQRRVDQPLNDQNYGYGDLFEHFVIQEIRRRAEYSGKDYGFYFLRTDRGEELDLIIDRPGRARAIVEIKSSRSIREDDIEPTQRLGREIKDAELWCLSRDPDRKQFGNLCAIHWQTGIGELI